jgi:hypothetical protein
MHGKRMTVASAKPRRKLLHQPKPVVERWIRRWTTRTLQPKIYALVRAHARRRLLRTEQPRQKALQEAFETTVHYATKNEGGSFPAFSVLLNIGLYLLLAERDIQAVKIDALTHPDEWTRKLNARVILLTIYEWDADKVSGRSLREALNVIEAPPDLRQEAIAALRHLRLVQRRARLEFGIVRNSAIAHRDPDALRQFRCIRDLRVDQVLAVTLDFYSNAEAFMHVLSRLMVECGSLQALISQWKPKSA